MSHLKVTSGRFLIVYFHIYTLSYTVHRYVLWCIMTLMHSFTSVVFILRLGAGKISNSSLHFSNTNSSSCHRLTAGISPQLYYKTRRWPRLIRWRRARRVLRLSPQTTARFSNERGGSFRDINSNLETIKLLLGTHLRSRFTQGQCNCYSLTHCAQKQPQIPS